MGRTTRAEKDVLKLVHPGKHIEIFTTPISASELLNKYPKFCITRPDVFKFPWIVVKSDSLLVPGKVFFLVPKRTLYHLLKANQPPSGSSLPPLSLGPSTASAGMTPKHKITRHSKRAKLTREDDRISESSWIYSFSRVHECYKYCDNNVVSAEVSRGEKVFNDDRGKQKMTLLLRSCMRKPGSAPRLANLRVRFSIPGEDVVEPITQPKDSHRVSFSKFVTSLTVDVCR